QQRKADGLLFPQTFAPGVEGVFSHSLFFTELLHGNAAALLRADQFGPLFRFRLGRRLLADTVAHDTTIHRHRARLEERFTRRLPTPTTPAASAYCLNICQTIFSLMLSP